MPAAAFDSAVTKGSSKVDNRARFSNLSASYNDFLFATVCDDANGLRLSVLSALARMNVDPWEEATRLATMPKAIAERTLASVIDLASGRSWNPSEAAATAARLVRLLPDPDAARMAANQNVTERSANAPAKTLMQRPSYWWVWIGFALAMSLLSPNPDTTKANPGMAPVETSAPAAAADHKSLPMPIAQSR